MDKAQLDRIADEVQGHLRLGAEMRPTLELYARRLAGQLLVICNRGDIPPLLEGLAGEMLEDMLRVDGEIPSATTGAGEVASISRGDTSISYRDKGGALRDVGKYLKDWDRQLTRFKKPNLPRSEA